MNALEIRRVIERRRRAKGSSLRRRRMVGVKIQDHPKAGEAKSVSRAHTGTDSRPFLLQS